MPASTQSLRDRLKPGQPPFLFSWMSIANGQLAGQVARLPFDGVCIDMQHGMIGFSETAAMVAAINAAGSRSIVRVLWNEPGLTGQVLDAAAAAVIAPMVNTRAQAELLVKSTKYPPMGGRSWGGYGMVQASGLSPAEYLKQANSLNLVFAMIETREALNNVDEIAATPGLDGLFVGPSDLSIALSNGAELNRTNADTLAAMKLVAAACDKHGLVPGAFAGTADIIKAYVGLGYRFLAASVELDLMKAGAEALAAAVKTR